jgi:hypothetical protein
VDLLSIAHEFVRPAAKFAALVGGSSAKLVPPATTEINLAILCDEAALKRSRTEICGKPLTYEENGDYTRPVASLQLGDIRLKLQFLVSEDFPVQATPLANELAVLSDGWVMTGDDVVERWRSKWAGT